MNTRLLEPLRLQKNKPPFYLIHPVGGNLFCYRELLDVLPEFSYYGIRARGQHPQEEPARDLEEMASHYADLILQTQPADIILGGWSMGGVIALKIAQKLTDLKHPVWVVLWDSFTPEAVKSIEQNSHLSRSLMIAMELAPLLPNWITPSDLANPTPDLLDRVFAKIPASEAYSKAFALRYRALLEAHFDAFAQSNAEPYVGPTLLIQATALAPGSPRAEVGWRSLLPQCQVISVPGNHVSVLSAANLNLAKTALLQFLTHSS